MNTRVSPTKMQIMCAGVPHWTCSFACFFTCPTPEPLGCAATSGQILHASTAYHISSSPAVYQHQRWRICDEICTSGVHRHPPTVQPPCTHRSVHWVRRINDFSTLRQQNLTCIGIECWSLRGQQDSESTSGQRQRFASPCHPSPQLDQKRCQNGPEPGVPEMTMFFGKG